MRGEAGSRRIYTQNSALPQLPDPAQDVTSSKKKTKTKMQDKIFVLFLFFW